jgi:hypothetical protein
MLHYKACARTRKQKVVNIIIMIAFGLLAMLYTTIQTVRVRLFHVLLLLWGTLLIEPGMSGLPKFGHCDVLRLELIFASAVDYNGQCFWCVISRRRC